MRIIKQNTNMQPTWVEREGRKEKTAENRAIIPPYTKKLMHIRSRRHFQTGQELFPTLEMSDSGIQVHIALVGLDKDGRAERRDNLAQQWQTPPGITYSCGLFEACSLTLGDNFTIGNYHLIPNI